MTREKFKRDANHSNRHPLGASHIRTASTPRLNNYSSWFRNKMYV